MSGRSEDPAETIARLEAELAQLRADYDALRRDHEQLQHYRSQPVWCRPQACIYRSARRDHAAA